MYAQTLCAQVASRLGEPLRLIQRRGFQPVQSKTKHGGEKLAVVDCPFCGQQVMVAPNGAATEAECRGCDTAFTAEADDLYFVSLDDAKRPQARRFHHEVY